ncbi:hypothetical protein ACLMJK_002808 [Lecanora helva]
MSRLSDYGKHRSNYLEPPDLYAFPDRDPYDAHSEDPRYRRYAPEGYGDGRFRTIPSDPFMSEHSNPRLFERYTRGYDPPYYGRTPSYTGSQPGAGDYGFILEDTEKAPGTRMADEYAKYKKLNEQSDLLDGGYDDKSKGIGPRPPRKKQTEEYYGSPSMIRRHHREMYDHSSAAADVTRDHYQARADFDERYRFHYENEEMRDGHLKAIDDAKIREARLRGHEKVHKKHGVDVS